MKLLQDGNNVSLVDKNEEIVNGSINMASYVFNFRELENINDDDYIDFHLELKLSSDTSCTGTYRMDERTFFTAYNESFYCITEGTLVGSCPYDPTKYIERGTVRDIDNNIYQTVKIGDQWWMAENLKVTRYRNGDVIPHVTDNSTWQGLSTGAFCSSDNADSNIATYGLLYNWYAVGDSRNIAPAGWHIPTDNEWKELEMHLGMSQSQADASGWRGTFEGGKLKETETLHWSSPNYGASNETGFTALPGGHRFFTGGYNLVGTHGDWWSATEIDNNNAWNRELYYQYAKVLRYSGNKTGGVSIRCVKD